MANEDKVFKRINFFKGFVTTEDDWNEAERYHVEKRKLHNRAFHGAGVVQGWGEEFRVAARGKGELSVEVAPGYAIDGQGNVRPLLPRSFESLSHAEEENGQSRIYLGIHWVFDKTEGIEQGRRVARYVADNIFTPR